MSFPIGHFMKNNLIAPRCKKRQVYLRLLSQIESMIIIKAVAIKWLLDCNVGDSEPISH